VVKKVVRYTGFSHIGNFPVLQAQTQETLKPRLSAIQIQIKCANDETHTPQVGLFWCVGRTGTEPSLTTSLIPCVLVGFPFRVFPDPGNIGTGLKAGPTLSLSCCQGSVDHWIPTLFFSFCWVAFIPFSSVFRPSTVDESASTSFGVKRCLNIYWMEYLANAGWPWKLDATSLSINL
jgi:hypothetical protein